MLAFLVLAGDSAINITLMRFLKATGRSFRADGNEEAETQLTNTTAPSTLMKLAKARTVQSIIEGEEEKEDEEVISPAKIFHKLNRTFRRKKRDQNEMVETKMMMRWDLNLAMVLGDTDADANREAEEDEVEGEVEDEDESQQTLVMYGDDKELTGTLFNALTIPIIA